MFYQDWAKRAISLVVESPGIIEVRDNCNVLVSPYVCATSVWKTLVDWANFVQSDEWVKLAEELQNSFADNVNVEIWGASPVIPEPLRPKK